LAGLRAVAVNQALRAPTLKGRIFLNPTPSVNYLWMNNDVAPFNNPKVRQAVNYAINRNAILRVWGGRSQGQITDQVLPPTMGGYRERRTNPENGPGRRAKGLLPDAAGSSPVKPRRRRT